jgi:serine/threonine-protein kinase ULK2
MNNISPPPSSSSFAAVSRMPLPTSEMTPLGSPRTGGFDEQNSSSPSSSGQQRVKIVADYALQQRLGSGSFAVVYKGVRIPQSRAVHETVAVKAISRTSEKLTKKVLQNLEIEINILRSYRHRNIVCMHDVQKTEHHFYLILEFCGGGDVQKLIRTRQKLRLTERLTRRLMRDLSSGLRFLWGQELIHRVSKAPALELQSGYLPIQGYETQHSPFSLVCATGH